MKMVLPFLCCLASQVVAQDWAVRAGDDVLNRAELSALTSGTTLIFFDANGHEIIRVDSVVQFYRLQNVLDYILEGGYLEHETFQRWRESRQPLEFR